jgi:enoyl-CoA hydratase/carnithine racemase
MIEHSRHGDIHELRLGRPPVNALHDELLDAILAALGKALANGARGIVISGNEKVFSGGMDVPYLMSLDRPNMKACWSRFFAAARALAGSPVPVAAAITGHNPAGGCVLALCCDYRVMALSPDPTKPFRIGLNETQVGLAVPEAIQYLMRRIVGAQRAERLIVAGAMVESERAHALGIVDEIADPGDVVARCVAWLQSTLALPSAPMLATRKIARADIVAALAAFGDRELDGFLDQWDTPDTQAALQAVMARLKK